MSFKKVNLIAPNNLDIVGIKLIDNTVSEFSCSYCKENLTQFWTIPPNAINDNNVYIFIDMSDNEWRFNQNEIVYNSLTKNMFIQYA